MPRRKVQRCPNCGHVYHETSTGRKKILKIWVGEKLEEIWINFAKNYETRELAFEELLKKAGLISEKTRAYVEASRAKS